MIIFGFKDGSTFVVYDADATQSENRALHIAFAREIARRNREKLPRSGVLRVATADEIGRLQTRPNAAA